MRRFYKQLSAALAKGEPFALGIISSIKGSSPQKKGAKAIFFGDGTIEGTLGGGCLEAEIQDRARRAIQSKTSAIFDLVLDHDFGWDDGLICGGKVSGLILPRAAEAAAVWQRLGTTRETISWGVTRDFEIRLAEDSPDEHWFYQEAVLPPCQLWIAGSGHVAQAVAALAITLDFEVTVLDDRPALANNRFFAEDTRFEVGPWERLLQNVPGAQPAFGLIVTRGHQHDALALREWIKRPFVFLGMIGSSRKKRLIFDQFIRDGLATAEQLANVACPVGIDIQSVSVPEIALSIMAQYVQKRASLVYRIEHRSRGEKAAACAGVAE